MLEFSGTAGARLILVIFHSVTAPYGIQLQSSPKFRNRNPSGLTLHIPIIFLSSLIKFSS